MKRLILAVVLFVTPVLHAGASADAGMQNDAATAAEPKRTVVWVSVDGVRPDYVRRGNTPTLRRLMREGAYTEELIPVFPSLTFPSHVSLATGVKAGKHGVMGNSFIT